METCIIESGLQLLSRINERSASKLRFPIFQSGPYPNQTVEITGGPASGKTSLLLDIVVKSVLPKQYKGIRLPGNATSVALINTDHQFNLSNIIRLIEFTIRIYANVAIENDVIEDCLRNITIFNCYNSDQVKFTFLNLEKLLQQNNNISVVAVDSLSAYYWLDRLDLGIISFHSYCCLILQELKSVVKDFGVVTFFTRPEVETSVKNKLQVNYSVKLRNVCNNIYEAVLSNDEETVSSVKYVIDQYINFAPE